MKEVLEVFKFREIPAEFAAFLVMAGILDMGNVADLHGLMVGHIYGKIGETDVTAEVHVKDEPKMSQEEVNAWCEKRGII
jgi:hypothetical protein